MNELSVIFSRLVLVNNSQHHPQFHPITPYPKMETSNRFTVNQTKILLELKISITYIQSLSRYTNKMSSCQPLSILLFSEALEDVKHEL